MYRFRDERGRVIYVGKAKSLRQRLDPYFADFTQLHPRTQAMLTTAAKMDWTVVKTEVEALQLEYPDQGSTPGSTSSTATTRATPTSRSPWTRSSRGSW